ncbi:MAG: C_GCAxxG_C_C family protein [Ruminococcus sp.]|nr:C_GCAxxG_C_C family protein [Ruminococcus sp.]
MTKAETAAGYHKSFYPCSAAVLCAFCKEAGLTEQEAKIIAKPFAGGRMGKCGAVLAAEYVLEKHFPDGKEKAEELERRFKEMNKSVMCRELKGGLTGQVLRPCRGCVIDAAEILESMLKE